MPDLTKAPECGTVYAVTDSRVYYEKYHGKKELEDLLPDTDKLLELHLFDSMREYRHIKKSDGSCLESVVTDSSMAAELGWENDDLGEYTYEESVFVTLDSDKQDDLKNRAGIVNYIQYDSDDMLHIVNYRLKEV